MLILTFAFLIHITQLDAGKRTDRPIGQFIKMNRSRLKRDQKNARHKWPGAYGVKFCFEEIKRRRADR